MPVFTGTDDNDSLRGGSGKDTIIGGGGDDVIFGRDGLNARWADGADLIDAGTGNDSVFADAGDDTVDGGEGDDYLFGGTGSDSISGGVGADTLVGGDGNDILVGNDDEGEADLLIGDDGWDKYFVGANDVVLFDFTVSNVGGSSLDRIKAWDADASVIHIDLVEEGGVARLIGSFDGGQTLQYRVGEGSWFTVCVTDPGISGLTLDDVFFI